MELSDKASKVWRMSQTINSCRFGLNNNLMEMIFGKLALFQASWMERLDKWLHILCLVASIFVEMEFDKAALFQSSRKWYFLLFSVD